MARAVDSVTIDGKGLRESARLYGVPIETLRQWVTGSVEMDCKPGPASYHPFQGRERQNLQVFGYNG